MAKQSKKDLTIRIEMTDNGGIICEVMDRDEPMEDKKYTYSSVDEAVAKVKSLLSDEKSEDSKESDNVPTTRDKVKASLHAKNIGSTKKEMVSKGY